MSYFHPRMLPTDNRWQKGKFDFLAEFYHTLANLATFGNYGKAKKRFLPVIKASDTILIIGGGNGKLLEYLPACRAAFVEPSNNMVRRAKRRKTHAEVKFIKRPYPTPLHDRFDFILFPYFLDLFSDEEVKEIIAQSKKQLKPHGKLLVTDFDVPNSQWQKQWLKTAIVFHRLIFHLKPRRFPSIRQLLAKEWRLEECRFCFGRFIFTSIWTPGRH